IVDQKTITAVLEKMVLFMNKDAVNAASGLQDLKYYQNPKAAMKLYANKLRPELFLLEWKGLGYTREERLRVPPGWADMKDVTLEESEDFINNLDLSPRK
ncbi:MAG TPA: hypothetical protein PKO06_21295, partial [Candidatus Ozemobacteraceae bacterium]|nr:hypothetical protein [Candidatus Ozemobacteraceae bacterium]